MQDILHKNAILEEKLKEICKREQVNIKASDNYLSLKNLTEKTRKLLNEKLKVVKHFKIASSRFLRDFNSARIISDLRLNEIALESKMSRVVSDKVTRYQKQLTSYFKKLKESKTFEELEGYYLETQIITQRAYNYIESMDEFYDHVLDYKQDIRSSMVFVKYIYRRTLSELKEIK